MQLASQSHRRSGFVTFLSWAIIVLSALLIPVSALALLMILAGGPGTSTFDPVGFFTVVVLPSASLVAAIGLLRRRRWGWYGVIALLGFLIAVNGWELLTAREGTQTFTSESGVQTTVISSGPSLGSLLFLGISVALLAGLLRRSVRDELGIGASSPALAAELPAGEAPIPPQSVSHEQRGWRVGHLGRDRMYYEELRGGTWMRIEIDGEMLTGRAHHVIYFPQPHQWQSYPEWARDRREEIIARVKTEFRPPDYEYYGESVEPSGSIVPPAMPPAPAGRRPHPLQTTPKQMRALVVAILLLLGVSGGMGWLVASGLRSNTTYFPAKRATQQRTVSREAEPVMFWASITIYSAIGLATGGMALWLSREGLRIRRADHA